MAFSDLARRAAVDGITALGGWISLHTADPGTSGAGEVTGSPYGRVESTFPAAENAGAAMGSPVDISLPEGDGSTTITHWGMWTDGTGGDFITGGALSTEETFSDAGGTYVFTPTITADG